MARYIKANPLVARFLNLDNERNTVSDGNYLFWQADMLKFGPLTQLNDILVKIGGLALSPHEAREEQDGTVCRQLPLATDARFQRPIKANVNDAVVTPSQGGNEEEQPSTDNGSDGNEEEQPSTDNGSDGNETEGQATKQGDEEAAESDGNETEGQATKQGDEEAAESDADADGDPDTAGQESEQTKSETDK